MVDEPTIDRPARTGRRTLDRAREAIESAVYGTALYRVSLRGKRPEALTFGPTDPWPGDANQGQALNDGCYAFAGQAVTAGPAPWNPEGASAAWLEAMHGFQWLRHMAAAGGAETCDRVHGLVTDWIAAQGEWDPLTWRSDVLGRRLVAWLSHSTLLLGGAGRQSAEAILTSLAEQARHLGRVATAGPDGAPRIAAVKGLVFAALCLPGDDRRLVQALHLLDHEVGRQIHADGGHASRSPAVQLSVFRDLVELRGVVMAARQPVPTMLQTAIDRMAPVVRFFRHGDGGLTLFNDSTESDPALIDVALALGDAPGQPPLSAPHTGFERMVARRTLVITDVGAPGPLAAPHAHGGTLSFEMSIDGHRLVVNCGAHGGSDSDWRQAQRATAAHSTAAVENADSLPLDQDGNFDHCPGQVDATRQEDEGATWIDASHDGFVADYGISHRRRLYLAADGDSLRGEDTLSGHGAGRFTIRFHLHPTVKASLVADGTGALLRLPGGEGWRMRSSGAMLVIADSIYLGHAGAHSRSEQIVLSGPLQGGVTTVKWALSRIGG
ncbi:MAG: heparinase II/III family protein [Alphaproteobacteria bacterium]